MSLEFGRHEALTVAASLSHKGDTVHGVDGHLWRDRVGGVPKMVRMKVVKGGSRDTRHVHEDGS